MPFIPTIVNEESVRAGPPQSRASGDAFGAGVGAAEQQFGEAVKGFGAAVGSAAEKQQARKDALGVATVSASSTFTPTYNDTVSKTDPSGAGLVPEVGQSFDDYMNQKLAEGQKQGLSSKGMDALRLDLLRQKESYINGAANQASKLGAVNDVLTTTKSLDNLRNDVALHGATSQADYQRTSYGGDELIAAQSRLTEPQRIEAKRQWHNDLARTRFDAMRDAAKTPAEVQALQAELNTPFWKGEFAPSDLQKEADQLAASAQRWGELGVGTTADEHVNTILAKPEAYTTETKKGLDKILAQPGAEPVKQQAAILDYRSNAAGARFEGLAVKAKTPADIQKLRDEAMSDKWRQEFTQQGFKQTLDSLDRHENAIDQALKSEAAKNDAAQTKAYNLQEAQFASNISTALERSNKGQIIPDAEYRALRNTHTALLTASPTGMLTPEHEEAFAKVFEKQDVLRKVKGLPVVDIEAAKRAEQTGTGSDEVTPGVIAAPGGATHAPAGTPALSPNDPRLAPVKLADGRTLMVDKRYQKNFQGFIHDYEAAGGVLGPNTGTLGERPNNGSYHPLGGAIDVNQVGWGKRGGGKSLPPDVEDRLAAKWNLRSGNHFRGRKGPDTGHFDAGGGRGGGGAAGRSQVTGFYHSLSQFEASNTNAPHSYATTSSGMARGYFQITDGTWNDFGGAATGYKTASDAPYEVQKQIADKIPMNRWAPETLNKMQKAGWTIYPTKTLAENAALNGDNGSGAPVDGGGGGAGAGGQSVTSGISASQSNRIDAYDTAIAETQKALGADPIRHAIASGIITDNTLLGAADADAWSQRAKDYAATDKYFNLTDNQRKPFTAEESAAYGDLLASNKTADKMALYKSIASWPESMQTDAYKQLAEKNPFGAAVGRLSLDNATMAMQGDGILKGIEGVGKNGAAWQSDADKGYLDILGASMRGSDPTHMAGQKRVYDAIYAAKNGPAGEFDAAKYQQIIENVEGGPIGVVNGAKTIMPQGVTHGEFEASLTSLDYNAVSLFQKPPVAWNDHHDALVPIQDWAKQLLQPIRAEPGLYMFMNDKGEFLSVADPQSPTGVRAYVARLDAATIKTAAARSQTNIDVLGSRGARAPAVPSSLGAGVGPAAAFDPNAFPDPAVERSLALPEPVHVPKEHRLNMERSVDAYKRALTNSGRSKEYVDQAGKDFLDNLMNVYRQGHGGSQR